MNIYYLESSALLKLFIEESSSSAMHDWIKAAAADSRFVTSDLSRVEVLGKMQSFGQTELLLARRFLEACLSIPVKKAIIVGAVDSMSLGLRTLDAVHHSTAKYLREDKVVFISYDEKLLKACELSGVKTYSPGVTSEATPSA